jgi:hypothetical protein
MDVMQFLSVPMEIQLYILDVRTKVDYYVA